MPAVRRTNAQRADEASVSAYACDRFGSQLAAEHVPRPGGYIAQWLERLTADQQVPGSNPGVPFSVRCEGMESNCKWKRKFWIVMRLLLLWNFPVGGQHILFEKLLKGDMPAIAQLVEHLTVECCSYQMVPGSIPGGRI